MRALETLCLLGTLACASVAASCTDPVLDDAIAKLGDEPAKPGVGPDHRPGQPCVLCHQPGGTSDVHLAVGGTVYDKADPKTAIGVEGVEVQFVDSLNNKRSVRTRKSGNFYIRAEDWPNLRFPFHVRLAKEGAVFNMTSPVGREPSCAGCHRDPVKGVTNDRFGAKGRLTFPPEK